MKKIEYFINNSKKIMEEHEISFCDSEGFVSNILKIKENLPMFQKIILAVFEKYYKGRDILFFSNQEDWHFSLEKVKRRNKLCWYIMVLHIIHLYIGFDVKVIIDNTDFNILGQAANYLKKNVLEQQGTKITLPESNV